MSDRTHSPPSDVASRAGVGSDRGDGRAPRKRVAPTSDDEHVLVVDDEIDCRETLSLVLGDHGYNVRIARNGEEALAKADHDTLVVLLDIGMPGMGGFEVCSKLLADETRSTAVIFLTGRTSDADIIRAFQVGGSDYIQKPFTEEELVARIGVHAKLQRAYRALEQQNSELQAAVERIEALRGEMLTVCAWTNRIKSAGRWISLEEFLSEHLDLSVSHGISKEGLAMFRDGDS